MSDDRRIPRWLRWILEQIGAELFHLYVWPWLKALALKGWALLKAAWAFMKCFWAAAKTATTVKAVAMACACGLAF
jgi:hypothetical protein